MSDAYAAVIVWLPRARVELVKETTPLPFTGACASTVLPSCKVTWPVGVPEPGGAAATVTVNVTDWPGVDGFGEAATVVAVALGWTNWISEALPALKLASPL